MRQACPQQGLNVQGVDDIQRCTKIQMPKKYTVLQVDGECQMGNGLDIHKYKFKYEYTNTNIQIQIHKNKYKNPNTQA